MQRQLQILDGTAVHLGGYSSYWEISLICLWVRPQKSFEISVVYTDGVDLAVSSVRAAGGNCGGACGDERPGFLGSGQLFDEAPVIKAWGRA